MKNLIDTHMHLDYFKNHFEIYNEINQLKQYTLCVTNQPEVFESCMNLYNETKYLKFAIGYNPQLINEIKFNKKSFLKNISKTRYIGEVGLDFSNKYIKMKSEQIEVFNYICKFALNNDKILSVHSRKAEKEALQIIKNNNCERVILHWYTGPLELIEEFVVAGCYFSVNYEMINRNTGLEKIKRIPLDRILIETDAPMGKFNRKEFKPKELIKTYKIFEEIFDIDVRETVYKNFMTLLIK